MLPVEWYSRRGNCVHHIGFRLSDNTDPEERLEEAALWKAMSDLYGDRISAVTPESPAGDDWIMFGRGIRFGTGQEPVSSKLDYWTDPAFLDNCGREFSLVPYEGLRAAVADLHARGVGAFVKSTRMKHFVCRIPVGVDVDDAVGPMAFSFMDGGPSLMVQALAEVKYEYRFFVVAREIVADSPVMVSLTPLDHRESVGMVYETPTSARRHMRRELVEEYFALAEKVIADMVPDHVVIDIALIDGEPALIEMNPMQLGQVGLYASNVRNLAAASETLIEGFVPQKRPLFTVSADDEEDFDDGAEVPSSVSISSDL
jgi:hypothetical protein